MSNGWNDQGIAHGNQRPQHGWDGVGNSTAPCLFQRKCFLCLLVPLVGRRSLQTCQRVPTGQPRAETSVLVPVPADSLWVTLEHLATISPKNCTESTDLPSTDVAAGFWLVPEQRRFQCPEKEEVHGSMMDKCLPEVSDPLGVEGFLHREVKASTSMNLLVVGHDAEFRHPKVGINLVERIF